MQRLLNSQSFVNALTFFNASLDSQFEFLILNLGSLNVSGFAIMSILGELNVN